MGFIHRNQIVCVLVLLFASCASYTYTVRTVPGRAKSLPEEFHGASPGPVTTETLKKNGWALAESREGMLTYIRGGTPDLGASEVETIAREQSDGSVSVDVVRMRYAQTRLATYKSLLQTLIDRHGAPQSSVVQPSFDAFVLDPRSDRPRPPRVVVHRWSGTRADLVLVAGLEDAENLASAMDYQVLLLKPAPLPAK